MSNKPDIQYFHCYVTSNDRLFYFEDIKNLINIRDNCSGVEKVVLYIAISKAKRPILLDKLFVNTIKKVFAQHATISLRDISFKENAGRDFSSYSYLNKKIQKEASPDDYVFFQNRSGCGPFRKRWYEEFITQFEKFDSAALCGSTINYKDHPSRSEKRDMPHVQTYALLTKTGFLKMIESAFPGADETERSKIILEGEIGLSQFYLNKEYGITCMEWTDRLITKNSKPISDTDIKEFVSADHQFYHRKYIANNKQRKIRNPLGRPLQIYIKHIFK